MVLPPLVRILGDFRDIFGEPDLKRGGKRISGVAMASASRNQVEKLTKGMVSVVEFMLKARDHEVLIDKDINCTVEIVCRFGGKNVMDALTTITKRCSKGMSMI